MNITRALHTFLQSNPLYRGLAEKIVIVATGIGGLVCSWVTLPFSPWSNILGGLLAFAAYAFHLWAERDHREAHSVSQDIEFLVTSGVYAKIRHPLYLSLIAMNIGLALAFGVLVTCVLALLSVGHWTLTAREEEAVLSQRFPQAYARYRQKVRWRMIPGIF